MIDVFGAPSSSTKILLIYGPVTKEKKAFESFHVFFLSCFVLR